MQERCYRCFRPLINCFCPRIVPIETNVKFVFLLHPKEAYHQKTGTGRLAALSLSGAEIIVGIDFTENTRVRELTSGRNGNEGYGDGAGYYPVVLYPSADSLSADSPALRTALGERKLLVIVIDATWFFARKMLKASANLTSLPTVSFRAEYRSVFEIKRQPSPECLSTIESAHYLIRELKAAGIANPEADESGLMRVFREMVRYQLAREQERHEAEAAALYPELFDS